MFDARMYFRVVQNFNAKKRYYKQENYVLRLLASSFSFQYVRINKEVFYGSYGHVDIHWQQRSSGKTPDW